MGLNPEQQAQQNFQEIIDLIPKDLPLDIQEKLTNQVLQLKSEVVTFEELQEHVQKLYTQNIVELHYGLCKFGKFLATESAAAPNELNIQQVLDFNIASKIFDILREYQSTPIIMYEAAWIVANLAYGTKAQIQIIQQNGGIELLIRLLKNEKPKICEQAVMAVGNIAADCDQFRNQLLEKGAIDLITKITKECLKKKSKFIGDCAWTLCNLCRGQPKFYYVKNSFDVFSHLISQLTDEESLMNLCWALSNISDEQEAIQLVINSGVVPRLVELLNHQSIKIQIPALRVIGNILTGNEEETSYVLKQNLNFKELLKNKDNTFIKEACWCLSNITAGSPQQVNTVIQDKQLIRQLFQLIETSPQEIQKEIAWIFTNASSHANAQDIINIADQDLINAFSKLLDIEDTQTLIYFLEGIFILLQKGQDQYQQNKDKNKFLQLFIENKDIVIKIENHQTHTNEEIYDKATNIIETLLQPGQFIEKQ